MSREMTDKETERLDKIHNLTYEFLQNLIPGGGKAKGGTDDAWDRDLIDDVLETVWNGIKDKGICTENEFYPYRDDDE